MQHIYFSMQSDSFEAVYLTSSSLPLCQIVILHNNYESIRIPFIVVIIILKYNTLISFVETSLTTSGAFYKVR